MLKIKHLWPEPLAAADSVCPFAETPCESARTAAAILSPRESGRAPAATPTETELAILDLVRYGDPRLLAPNEEVDPRDPTLPALLADMFETCHAAPGVGLAAPQIGVNRRVAVIDLSVGADPSARIALVNPVVVESSGEQKEEEGCLSIPDLVEPVVRPARVRATFFDGDGEPRELEGTGLLARALSHEIDHLNGILYVDRLRGLKRELTWRKIERLRARGLW
jgi:peptide deformylase